MNSWPDAQLALAEPWKSIRKLAYSPPADEFSFRSRLMA